MGRIFIEEEEKRDSHTLISPDRYDQIIAANPDLYVHP